MATDCVYVAEFCERAGLICERDGLPRIAGRILGLLLLSPAPLSLETMAERLGVSRASVSTDTRRLEQRGVLRRTSRPGDRRDYYVLAPDHHLQGLAGQLGTLREFLGLLDEACHHAPPDGPVRDRLDASAALYRDVLEAVSDVLARHRAGAERAVVR